MTTLTLLTETERLDALDILNDHMIADRIVWSDEEDQHIGVAADGTPVMLGNGDSCLAYLLDNPDQLDW